MMAKKSIPQARKEQKAARAKPALKTSETAKKKKPQQKQASTNTLEAKKEVPEGVDTSKLDARHIRFAEEYLIDLNATQAAIRAGYSKNLAAAATKGYELLRKSEVQAVIEAKRREVSAKAGLTMERIVTEAGRLALSDVRKIVDNDGNLKQIRELDDDTAAAIASVKLAVTGSGDDVEMVKEYKFWPKNPAIDTLIKHLGLKPAGGASDLGNMTEAELDAKIRMLIDQTGGL